MFLLIGPRTRLPSYSLRTEVKCVPWAYLAFWNIPDAVENKSVMCPVDKFQDWVTHTLRGDSSGRASRFG